MFNHNLNLKVQRTARDTKLFSLNNSIFLSDQFFQMQDDSS